MPRYKVVETMIVSDETLEQIINEWVALGWLLDSIQFVKSDASRRPAMAFVLFCRDDDQKDGE